MSLNKCQFIGNLTDDPEPRSDSVTVFTIAVNNRQRKGQGRDAEWVDEVAYINCTAFGSKAKSIASYLRRGSQVYVEARFKINEWIDKKTKSKRTAPEFIVNDIQFLSNYGDGKDRGNKSGYGKRDDYCSHRDDRDRDRRDSGRRSHSDRYDDDLDDDIPY